MPAHQARKNRTRFLEFCRYLRSLYPSEIRIAIVLDNFSPHLTTKNEARVGNWAAAGNVEFAYTPTNSSWLNRIEAQFIALRSFTLDGTRPRQPQGTGRHAAATSFGGTSTPPPIFACTPSSLESTSPDT